MKGIELPLNTIIVMAVVVIVLLATASFFFQIWTPGAMQIGGQQAFNTGCRYYDDLGCDLKTSVTEGASEITIENYDGGNLLAACRSVYGSSVGEYECLLKCSCAMSSDSDGDGALDTEDDCPCDGDTSCINMDLETNC